MSEGASTPPPAPTKKLYGRAFYESIGSPKFILAPMVDQSEFVRPPVFILLLQSPLTEFNIGMAPAEQVLLASVVQRSSCLYPDDPRENVHRDA
jgi:hypothetical protein